MILPRRLRPGSRLAAVSLSWGGPGTFPHRHEAGKRQLEDAFGVDVVEMPHTLADSDFVAANPQARVDDLHRAFADPSVDGIVSTIGGDDSIRLLRLLDLDLIAAHPKVFVGYSDTTIIHLACHRAGLLTFYGPSVMSGFGEEGGLPPYLVDGVTAMLFTAGPPGVWPDNVDGWTNEFSDWAEPENQQRRRPRQPSTGRRWLNGGEPVVGPLIPACLEVLDWLRGTDWWPDLTGAVLAVETSEDAPPPNVVRQFLRSLAAAGDLAKISAFMFARPGGVDAAPPSEYDDAIREVILDEERLRHLPIVTNLDFGHTDPMWTLPVGGLVSINPTAGVIEFNAPVTTD